MKAVILAAGVGKRLKPFTNDLPKAFISMVGSSLIYYSLNNIRFAGINTVIIVTGFRESFFKKKLGSKYNNMDIIYVSNNEYASTGSMYSLSKTEGIIDEDIILLESDLLYEKRAITGLINFSYPDVILTSSIRGSGDEVYIYMDDCGYLTNLGKNIQKNNANGELVGISKISLSFLKKLYNRANQDYKIGDKNYHYEEVIYELSKEHPVKCLFIKDLLWTEIDTCKDLEKARNNIYPKIKVKEN